MDRCTAENPAWDCCTDDNKCSENQGDCDYDSDCAGDLVCGTNNCQSTGVTGSNWASSADCCEGIFSETFISQCKLLQT